MTSPSRKRVVTVDDLNILNANSAYARTQGEAAQTGAAAATLSAQKADAALVNLNATIAGAADDAASATTGEVLSRVGAAVQASEHAFTELATDLRVNLNAGKLPPVVARPPVTDLFNAPIFAPGSIAGQRGWLLGAGATATVDGSGVAVIGRNGIISPYTFSEGYLRVQVDGTDNHLAMLWGGPAGPGKHYAVWNVGGNIEAGWWNINAEGAPFDVNPAQSFPAPAEDHWIEVTMATDYLGSQYLVRVWGVSGTRPGAPQMAVGINNSNPAKPAPLVGEGPVVLGTLALPVKYKALMIDDWQRDPNPLSMRAAEAGPWFSRYEGGVNCRTTITDGAEQRSTVWDTPGVALEVVIPPGMSYRPIIAARVCPEGGAWTDWVRTQVPSNNNPGDHVRVDTVQGLDITKRYRVEQCAIVHEDDALWEKGCGLLIANIIVANGGTCIPTDEDDLLLVEEDGTSIVASIVAGGHASSGPASQPTQTYAEESHLHVACDIINAVPYHSGYGATGMVKAVGSGGVPNAPLSTTQFMRGRKRTYRRKPNLRIIEHGVNDQGAGIAPEVFRAAYRAYVVGCMARDPGTQHLLMRPFLGSYAAEIQAVAVELGLPYIDTTGWIPAGAPYYAPNDGTHPLRRGQILAGQRLAAWLIANGYARGGQAKVLRPAA